jgi:Fic family protein
MELSEEAFKPLSEEELAKLDSKYGSFPMFAEWPQQVPELEAWDRSAEILKEVAANASEADFAVARDVAMRAAAFDTGAIEGLYSTNRGLTFSVAEQSAAWEQDIVEAQGQEAHELFKAQLTTLELVLDHVTERVPTVTQAWLRRLHEETTTPQDTYQVHTSVGTQRQPLPRGEYKRFPNHVRTVDGGVHAYAPVDRTQSEMQKLMRELESEEFRMAHPVVQASYAHYAFVVIHPFADGNGRVSRALASVYTYRAASVPLLVFADERSTYFSSLAKADVGDRLPFVEFIGRVGRETLDLVADNIKTALAPQPEEILSRVDGLIRSQQVHEERNAAAIRFADWVAEVCQRQVASLGAEDKVQATVQKLTENDPPPEGFQRISAAGTTAIRILLQAIAPLAAVDFVDINIYVKDSDTGGALILVGTRSASNERLELSLEDVFPQVSGVAERRVENYVRRVLGRDLSNLYRQMESELPSG